MGFISKCILLLLIKLVDQTIHYITKNMNKEVNNKLNW